MTAVSIVVPTRDRPASLERCLEALANQRGIESLEIVVVDDGSADGERVAAIVGARARTRLLRMTGAGPATARNAGVAAAAGATICFTDDDCEPAPDWAAKLAARLATGADAVGGTNVNGCPGNRFVEASELILRRLQESTSRRRKDRVFIPSNNLACRRVLALDHPFDERYPSAAAEDRAWCATLAAAGLTVALVPDAILVHRPALGPRSFWRQHVRYGRGAFDFARSPTGREWREPGAFYVGLLAAALARGPICAALVFVAQVATAVGFAREGLSVIARRRIRLQPGLARRERLRGGRSRRANEIDGSRCGEREDEPGEQREMAETVLEVAPVEQRHERDQ
jgi:GT2 family glycosyltransferase